MSTYASILAGSLVAHFKDHYLFTFYRTLIRSLPRHPCPGDVFISGQHNYSSATLSHRDVPSDSLKIGAQEMNEVVSVSLLRVVAFELERACICFNTENTFMRTFLLA